MHAFEATRENRRPKDDTTIFREDVYKSWNTFGKGGLTQFRP